MCICVHTAHVALGMMPKQNFLLNLEAHKFVNMPVLSLASKLDR